MALKLDVDPSWKDIIIPELKKEYMLELMDFLEEKYAEDKIIYPEKNKIFDCFKYTPFENVRVVILGQDPYHGKGQAHGLCFSVEKNMAIPPSLINIYKELFSDLGIKIPKHGYLIEWAREGVLLLNNVLTVEEGMPGSHHGKGWEIFTDKIIESLASKKDNLVFILWGAPAQKKGSKLDEKKHLIIKSPHPSPLSSYRGFFGSKPFSRSNNYLKNCGLREINWSISE